MKPPQGWLSLCLISSCLLAAAQPVLAQRPRPGTNIGGGGNFTGKPGGTNIGKQPGNPGFNIGGNQPGDFPDPWATGQPNGLGNVNTAAVNAASGVSTGLIVSGVAMLLVGLGFTGGVIYLALQGQKPSYMGGGGRRNRKKRRDPDD